MRDVTSTNWREFTPAELSTGIGTGHVDMISLGLEATVGIIKLIQTGVDNGPRGKRIRELQETDKKYAIAFEVLANRILQIEKLLLSLKPIQQ